MYLRSRVWHHHNSICQHSKDRDARRTHYWEIFNILPGARCILSQVNPSSNEKRRCPMVAVRTHLPNDLKISCKLVSRWPSMGLNGVISLIAFGSSSRSSGLCNSVATLESEHDFWQLRQSCGVEQSINRDHTLSDCRDGS